jgi:lipid A 3-O-deacylase
MNRVRGLALLLLAGITCPGLAGPAESPKSGTLSFVFENDFFCGTDRHYTSGMRWVWLAGRDAPTPEWAMKMAHLVPWFPEQGKIRHAYSIGQSVFTPSDIRLANPPLWDRPYAGWLYGTIEVGVESERQLDEFALALGIVGPASLAEQNQKLIHQVIGSRVPQGWDTQLGNEPGIVATYQRTWRRLATANVSGIRLDVIPHVGTALGNVFTYANAGLTVRLGQRLPDDYGPPRIQPGISVAGDFSPTHHFDWYLFVGIEGRAVARDIFLDGNTFHHSRRVDKEPLVGDLQFGIVLDLRGTRLSFTRVARSREFTTQSGHDSFGVIAVSVRL